MSDREENSHLKMADIHPEELILSTQVRDRFFLEKGIYQLFKDQVVLDVGCGTGFFTEKIAEIARQVYACEINFGNVNICRLLSISPRICCLNADAQILPFTSGSFDSVFVNSMVEHLDDPEIFFNEVWRVLKPGGQLVMSVDIKPRVSWVLYRLTFLFDKMIAHNHPMLHRKTALSDPGCLEFISPERLLAILEPRFALIEKERYAGLFVNILHVCLVMTNKIYQLVSGGNISEDHYADHINRLNRPIFRIYRGLLPLLHKMANPQLLTFDAVYFFARLKKISR